MADTPIEDAIRMAKAAGRLEAQVLILHALQKMTAEARFAQPVTEIVADDEEMQISLSYWRGYLEALRRVASEIDAINYTKNQEKSPKEDENE